MKKDSSFYWTLFLSTFTLSAFTFGGGYVIVPLMQKRFVKELKWINEEEMLDMVAIAQSSPGPIAVNSSIIVGYRMAGIKGALLSTIGTVLPPLGLITLISFFYAAFRSNPIISALLLGMQAGVAAVIINVIYDMSARIIKQKELIPIFMMIGAFVATIFFDVNILLVLGVCGLVGVLTYNPKEATKQAVKQRKEVKEDSEE